MGIFTNYFYRKAKDLNTEEKNYSNFADIHDLKGSSHSTRMLKLGNLIDSKIKSNGGTFSKDDFVEACTSVGVRPEAPWLLNID